ncbi:hypothetical protein BgiMline_000851 [Biomphalaria glabrata]|nr:hypothetical protein BgiMline_000796 [Biomphalaria glabrata]
MRNTKRDIEREAWKPMRNTKRDIEKEAWKPMRNTKRDIEREAWKPMRNTKRDIERGVEAYEKHEEGYRERRGSLGVLMSTGAYPEGKREILRNGKRPCLKKREKVEGSLKGGVEKDDWETGMGGG